MKSILIWLLCPHILILDMADVVDTEVCYPDSPFRNKALIPSAARNVGIVYMPTYEIKMSPN